MYDFKFFTFVWIMMVLAIVATLLVLKIIGVMCQLQSQQDSCCTTCAKDWESVCGTTK